MPTRDGTHSSPAGLTLALAMLAGLWLLQPAPALAGTEARAAEQIPAGPSEASAPSRRVSDVANAATPGGGLATLPAGAGDGPSRRSLRERAARLDPSPWLRRFGTVEVRPLAPRAPAGDPIRR